jgi:NADH-quinone oxidoreductase subunit C
MSKAFLDNVKLLLGSSLLNSGMARGEAVIHVAPKKIIEVLTSLRDASPTEMNQLVDLCGVDYPDREKRFEVVYQLLSLKYNKRLSVCVAIAKDESVPSVTSVYPSAGWFERETYDLFGIEFTGHPDLRRILTDYDFEGYPLRRDFPLSGNVQVRYDDLQGCVVKEPVRLEEPYREFHTQSKWRGLTDVQKRGRA